MTALLLCNALMIDVTDLATVNSLLQNVRDHVINRIEVNTVSKHVMSAPDICDAIR